MFEISAFFQKFLHLEKTLHAQKEVVVDVIKQHTGIILEEGMYKIDKDSLILVCSPVYRNEIFMYKDVIQQSLKSKKIFLELR